MKKDIYNYMQKNILFYSNQGFETKTNKEKEKYTKEKNNLETNKSLDFYILNLFEQNGFSMNELGTYLYKDIIKKIFIFLNKSSKHSELNELKNQLINSYSQFYLDIARYEHDMGLKTFHTHIQTAISKIDYQKANLTTIKELEKEKNYQETAYILATQLFNTNLLNNNEQLILKDNIKIHKLEKDI